jgi:uncharacterized membrane protein YsdA (DUF1294 family)
MEKFALWVIASNFIGFVLMVFDKAQAEHGRRRVSEAALIFWSSIGGSLGVLTAQQGVRHKTTKQPIAAIIHIMPVAHGALALIILFSEPRLPFA